MTSTRIDTPAFDVPAAVDRTAVDLTRDAQPGVNVSEMLGGVPGLLVRNRQNYAQDLQISVRGFGARSTFGIRGVRLFVDDIPGTQPDGQGQISNVDLGSAARIEVLRGPFSALYGNASGGVIQVHTEDPSPVPTFDAGYGGGSDGATRVSAKFSGQSGPFGLVASASRFHTDGWREHSRATRAIANFKGIWDLGGDTRLTLIGNRVSVPEAEDPLGLTRAQYEADPRAVDAAALAFDTRKSIGQTQGGALLEQRLGASDRLRVLVYGGRRRITQYQSIPVGAQSSPLSPGGVIGLLRDYRGTDLRWTHEGRLGELPFTLVGGIGWDGLEEHRRGWQNFEGQAQGVTGAERRNERNAVIEFGQYLQTRWRLSPSWTLDAGVRRSRVGFTSKDRYIVGANPDDSGGATYHATLPAFGLMYAASRALHLYAAAGRGFETPTLNELAYRPSGLTGPNFELSPARSRSVEFGAKLDAATWGAWNASVFATHTDDEIVVLTNSGGRTTYQNAGRTRRRGVELAWRQTYARHLGVEAAYTWLDATYSDTFGTCTGSPCREPNLTIAAGRRLPGLARQSLRARVAWAPPEGWRLGAELQATGKVEVDDANSDAAAGYAVGAVHGGYQWRRGAWTLDAFGRVDNAFDRRYIGSVIVGEGNGRFFEPAPGRTWWAGVNLRREL